ncbi:MAG: DUF2258 domain-containing protein [Desulfurococcaceae archaeon]|nr:DUF2258 domain-containing protein [Desulfurococcaceae archaeon]
MSATSSPSESREFSTGLVIAGAYADKVRRTLFAQLKDAIKQDKEFAREVARATAELNVVLYNILIEELKISKGDVVRVRINYRVDPGKRVTWLYDTLRVEAFKRVPDESVEKVVNNVVSTRLNQILEKLRVAPREAEKAVKEFEITEEEAEREVKAASQPSPTPLKPEQLLGEVSSVDIIGETADRGFIAKLSRSDGSTLGVVSLQPTSEGDVVIDAILVYKQKALRYLTRAKKSISLLSEEPRQVLDEISRVAPTEISAEDAQKLIEEKMRSLI